MPPQKKCEVCELHRSCYRRQCLGCDRLVGPGCFPEECLAVDITDRDGVRRGVCRECSPRLVPSKLAMICRRLPRAFEEERGKSPQKKCELCELHRSCYRRQCLGCNRLVGPGCFPEECLAVDLGVRDGIRRGICRECSPRVLPSKLAVICQRLPRALEEVKKLN